MLVDAMLFDHNSLNDMLNIVDRMIGRNYKDHELIVNQGQGMLKIRSRCRHCKRLIRSEQEYGPAGWTDRLIDVLVSEAETHAKKHQSLILLPGGSAPNV